MTLSLKALDGGSRSLSEATITALGSALRGTAVVRGEPGYDEARTLWNAMIDRHPGLVIRAKSTGDIQAAVNFARVNGLVMAVRGGGHQIAGLAVAEGALLLDLSELRSVEVDPGRRTARVAPGALLADVDAATQAHGLAVPTGINSTTGIAGLTLGGGMGWTTRKLGLTIDNLISAEVVTADGAVVHASAEANPDLFWAIRGGGGNFGVVASFEFRLQPLGPEVFAGLIVHPFEAAPELLRAYRRICASAPDELTVWVVMRKAPPLPFLPEEWHGREVLIFAACYAGNAADGEKAMAGLRGLGTPIADVIGPVPFAGWQQAVDPLLTPGMRNYWKSHDFVELPDAAVDAILGGVATLPDPQCEIFIAHIGGAMARVPVEATPFLQRAAHFTMNVHTRWEDAARDAECIGWARALFDKVAPYAAGSVYVNFMPDDEPGRVEAAYGVNMQRLRAIKAKYDPGNLFRVNHNIRPAAVAHAAE